MTVVEENGGMDISLGVSAAWGKWNKCNGVLCDREMPVKLKWEIIEQW